MHEKLKLELKSKSLNDLKKEALIKCCFNQLYPKPLPFPKTRSDFDFLVQFYKILFLTKILDSSQDDFIKMFIDSIEKGIERRCFNKHHDAIIYLHDFIFMYYMKNYPFKNKKILKIESLFKIWNSKYVEIYCCSCIEDITDKNG